MEANERNSSDKIYYEEQISESYLDQISLSDTPKLSSLMLSLMLETEWQVSLPLKVFQTESRDVIPLRGRAVTPHVFVTNEAMGLSSTMAC